MASAIIPPCPSKMGTTLRGRSSDLRFALLSEPSHRSFVRAVHPESRLPMYFGGRPARPLQPATGRVKATVLRLGTDTIPSRSAKRLWKRPGERKRQWRISDFIPAYSAGQTCRIFTDFPIKLPGAAKSSY